MFSYKHLVSLHSGRLVFRPNRSLYVTSSLQSKILSFLLAKFVCAVYVCSIKSNEY